MKTRITELLGIEKPIIQGGMAWVSEANLAAAVSEAGGLGIIGSGSASTDWVKDQIEQARAKTDRPIGVNIMMLSEHVEDLAQLMIDMHVDVVTTGVGSPKPYVKGWNDAGVKVMPLVSSVEEAQEMVDAGADALIAEGQESGGFIKEMTTMALVPAVCDRFDLPVVAAGGIADGRGMVAAFALGAEAIQMGTRFVASEECTVHENFKQLLLEADETGTIVTGRLQGHSVRQLMNHFSCKMIGLEKRVADGEDIDMHGMHAGSLRKAAVDGNVEDGSFMAGQIVALVNDIKPVRQIIDEILAQAERWGSHGLEEMARINAERAWMRS